MIVKHGSDGERHIQSVFRALKIMECVAENDNVISLTEVSQKMGLSKSTAHGLIATLEKYGYLQQDPVTGKYSLGLKTFELGQAYAANLDLREIALPDLRELSILYQETAHLAVLSGDDVVYIDKVDESRSSIGIRTRIGGRNPAYCTGVGKVLLSGLSENKVTEMYAGKQFQKFTKNTVSDTNALLEQLRRIREMGYALDMEEIEPDLQCVAAPIKDNQGTVIAAISLSGPANRFHNIEQIAENVAKAAMQISGRLGYRGKQKASAVK
ncbi:MAG: kdgR 1 [Firmicutes bacterium]|nr:kdgR 1 [Bacillota bacterium]